MGMSTRPSGQKTRRHRRGGHPPVFNRNLEDYVELLAGHGFTLRAEHRRPYARYAGDPRYRGMNTDLSVLVFRPTSTDP